MPRYMARIRWQDKVSSADIASRCRGPGNSAPEGRTDDLDM